MDERERIIRSYIAAYNDFDTEKMVQNLDKKIIFENVQNGSTTLAISGIENFKNQANQAKNYFEKRIQTVKSFKHEVKTTEIEVDYLAILALDFPNGLKKGDELKVSGKSIFEFTDENKISKLTDIS